MAQVGPDQAAHLLDGVSPHRDLILEVARWRLGGLLQAPTCFVVEPAVVWTTDSILLWDAVVERHAPVCARLLDESQLTRQVPIQDEILAKDPHPLGGAVLNLRRRGDRMPVAAHQLTAR